MTDRHPGKFAALVTDNDDPLRLCRVRVQVPELLEDETTGWCVPSSPYAGDNIGFAAVPPVGSVVWVEWPGGDPSRIGIWSGATWTSGAGVEGAGPEVVLLVTPAGHRIELRDSSGSETIQITSASGATVTMDNSGITLAFGSQKIGMTSASIDVNGGALKVT